jgi:hypothetical protein
VTYKPDKRTAAWIKEDYIGDTLGVVLIGAWHGNGCRDDKNVEDDTLMTQIGTG